MEVQGIGLKTPSLFASASDAIYPLSMPLKRPPPGILSSKITVRGDGTSPFVFWSPINQLGFSMNNPERTALEE